MKADFQAGKSFRSAASSTKQLVSKPTKTIMDNRPTAVAQRKLQGVAKTMGAKHTLKNQAIANPSNSSPIQMYQLKDSRFCMIDGIEYLAGDSGIDPDQVNSYIDKLRKGEVFPIEITYREVTMKQRTKADKDWSEHSWSEEWGEYDPTIHHDKKELKTCRVITGGHHRLIACIEVGIDPAQYIREDSDRDIDTPYGYNWSEVGGIEEEAPVVAPVVEKEDKRKKEDEDSTDSDDDSANQRENKKTKLSQAVNQVNNRVTVGF